MTKSRASSTAGEVSWEHDRSCRRPAHKMLPRSGTSKGPGRNRFLFLALPGANPSLQGGGFTVPVWRKRTRAQSALRAA